jgi:hypothetical protein
MYDRIPKTKIQQKRVIDIKWLNSNPLPYTKNGVPTYVSQSLA